MYRWTARIGLALLVAALLTVGVVVPTPAQEGTAPAGVQLLTPYLGVSVEPGGATSFTLEVVAPPGDEVELEVTGIPHGWDAQIRGGGFVVDRIMSDGSLNHNLKLEVDIPLNAAEGKYQVSVVATGATSSDRVDFDLIVAEAIGGGVSLNAEFPALQGPADVEFSFTLELANDTGEEVQFGLQAQGPTGWQITARPSGQSRASSVSVAPGGTERVTVEVDPPDFTSAGVYPVLVQAAGGGETANAELAVEITGNFALTLVTPDERLNFDVEAGKATELPIVVFNQGTAALADVSLSATPPRGWEVSFAPQSLDRVEAGGSTEVTATITPSSDAIAGDYRITMRASVPETNDSIEVRATVETSALWGLVGVAVILVALTALVLVFRRYGRR